MQLTPLTVTPPHDTARVAVRRCWKLAHAATGVHLLLSYGAPHLRLKLYQVHYNIIISPKKLTSEKNTIANTIPWAYNEYKVYIV